MPAIPRRPSGFFQDHLLDPRRPGPRARLTERLEEDGLVTLEGLERRDQVLDLARVTMRVAKHRDSDPDGLTTIRDTGRHHGRPGFAGLGSGELLPHTEGSGQADPPRLMMLALVRAADSGGACIVVDGRAVYQDLLESNPEALEALGHPRAALFGTSAGVFAPVLAMLPGGRIRLRLRQDDLVRFDPRAQPHVLALRAAINRHHVLLPLGTGQAYLLDNHRWLHARSAFVGPRLAYRALGEPQHGITLAAGFTVERAFTAGAAPTRQLVSGGARR